VKKRQSSFVLVLEHNTGHEQHAPFDYGPSDLATEQAEVATFSLLWRELVI